MLLGGVIGIVLSYALSMVIPTLPMLGPLFEDTSGKGDIHLHISAFAMLSSAIVLLVVGVASGMVPALQASTLDQLRRSGTSRNG
jgi:putative ABC transport system permease protein